MKHATRWAAAALSSLAASSVCAASLRIVVVGAEGRPAADTVVLVQPVAGSATAIPPKEPVVIVQQDIRFQPYVTLVPVGSTVRFVNRDSFDHHVRSLAGGPLGSIPPVKEFEFRLAAARGARESSADLKFDGAGSVVLGCHIHGSMRGHVLVSAVPFQAVTDAAGSVTLAGLPNGAAELRLWHPDQLTEQAAQKINLSGDVTLDAKLNFNPRRRPPPRRADEPKN
jgi:plastocyanin